jgi:hypothetical protein
MDDPAATLRAMRAVCRRFAVVDTHVADRTVVSHHCSDEVTVPRAAGGVYRGRWYAEFAADIDDPARLALLWASSTNERSFWPYADELQRMMVDATFDTVERVQVDPTRWQVDQTNRAVYVCTV